MSEHQENPEKLLPFKAWVLLHRDDESLKRLEDVVLRMQLDPDFPNDHVAIKDIWGYMDSKGTDGRAKTMVVVLWAYYLDGNWQKVTARELAGFEEFGAKCIRSGFLQDGVGRGQVEAVRQKIYELWQRASMLGNVEDGVSW